ncbi:MAG: Thiosulfate sulfurtransferase GlpE [Bacteroidia bacterium]|nr:Thiosulfate sulfurtransferase GlpE [Bacteroidia bacterium]
MKNRFNIISFFAFTFIIAACNNSGSGQQLQQVDAKTFSEKIHEQNNPVILDVRTPQEFEGGYIAGAINIDYNSNEFSQKVNKLDKEETVFVYCLSGGRSSSAAGEMRKNGFKNVIELKGGILKWKAAGLDIAAGSAAPKTSMTVGDFKKIVTADVPVLVDFYAPWCAPCRKMAPMLEELSKENEGKIKIVKINIDEHKQLAEEMGVTEIPIFTVYKNGNETARVKGIQTKEELLKILF